MQPEFVKNGFSRITQVCSRSSILNFRSTGNSLTSIQYGPLGSLMRRNIFREWLGSFLSNTDVRTFPLEIQTPRKRNILLKKLPDRSPDCLLSDVTSSFFQILHMNGHCLPFGTAVYGPCICNKEKEVLANNLEQISLLRNLEAWSRISLAFFCQPKKAVNWFHYWSRHRYRWWRKFSSIPSKFSMSDVSETPTGDQQLSLLLEFPWGTERLETITLYDGGFFNDLCLQYGCQEAVVDNSDAKTVAVITCEMELDMAVLAYLTNSFSEKWRDGELRNLFQFNVKLAPYKLSLCLDGSNFDLLKKLNDVANHLEKELQKAGVSVFPITNLSSSNTLPSQFYKFDEMGIPYIVVLNQTSLQTGIAGLRNRDTTLQEQVHIAELTPKVLKYLQIKSFDSDND